MRLIDAEPVITWLKTAGNFMKMTENHKEVCNVIGKIINHIENAPTIEAEPVVRCKDCEHGKSFTDAIGVISIHCSIFQTGMSQTGFCSMGKSAKGGAE